jgi:transcriptional regulator with XRE-family HTH domain
LQYLFFTFLWDVYAAFMPKKSGLAGPREQEIGRRVQQARERINWPQPAFAAELDISRDRLASIEYGRTPLRYPVAYRLCSIFDINPQWLANGAGEMTSSLALPDLPMPESQPPRALFSHIYDQHRAARPGAKGKSAPAAARKKKAEEDLIPNFDAVSHVIRSLTDLLSREKFRSPVERQEFALEVTTYARELALRLRRDATRDRARPVSSRRDGPSPRHADLAGLPARNAKTVLRLRDGIRRLDQEIGRLDAAMRSLNPVALGPASLPRPAAFEVARLEEATEKIASQIEEAERKIKALIARRTAA